MKRLSRSAGVLAGSLIALVLAIAPAAVAAPATVNLRVQGVSHAFPRTAVTTTAAPLSIGGHDCPGTTDAGALNAAIGGENVVAHWDNSFSTFALDSVYGEALGFFGPAFWAIMVNGQPNFGYCTSELSAGDEVVYYAACNSFYTGPPGTCYGDPLRLGTVPSQVTSGQPFQVKVDEATIDAIANTASYAPSVGATVTAGEASAVTDSQGVATLTVNTAGPVVVRATKGNRLDDSRLTTVAAQAAPPPVVAPVVVVDKAAPLQALLSFANGRKYTAAGAPRELKGLATDPSGILMVKMRITRRVGDRCSYYSGRKQRFVGAKCGAANGFWFKVADKGDWSYLLPERLSAGRYVIDVNAIDKRYNRDDARRRGSNRAVVQVA